MSIRVGSFWNKNYIEYESNGNRNKSLSLKEYLNEVNLYLKDIIVTSTVIWKFQSVATNLISSKDNDKEQVMHWKGDNIEVMTYDSANEVIKELFELLLSRNQIG